LVSINASTPFQGTRIMNTDRKLGEVAANLDDMLDTIEELQDAAQEEEAKSRAATLDELKQDVEQASDALDDVIDPEQPRKS
jgi:methyl-accepting chemotaxis protein